MRTLTLRANLGIPLLFLAPALISGGACAAETGATPTPQAAKVRDGSHDFDFLYGAWNVHNRRLEPQPDGSQQWREFNADEDCRALLYGLGNEDFYRTEHWSGFVGMSTRLYDPVHGLWSIYWTTNKQPGVVQGPPVVGAFNGKTGIFETADKDPKGAPIRVRYTWDVLDATHARWQLSISHDQGKTWETTWIMQFTRVPPPTAV